MEENNTLSLSLSLRPLALQTGQVIQLIHDDGGQRGHDATGMVI